MVPSTSYLLHIGGLRPPHANCEKEIRSIYFGWMDLLVGTDVATTLKIRNLR